jgi:hypothetical protein
MAPHDQEDKQVDDIATRLRRDCMSLIADEAADVIDRLCSELKVMTDEHRLACEDRDLMIRQRDEARREILLWVKELCSWSELREEIKKRGWEYLKEDGK